MLLIDKKPYNKITISDITKKAGITRPTFYRNYKNKDDVLIQYFLHGFKSEMFSVENITGKDNQDTIMLRLNIKYYVDNYAKLKKALSVIENENLFFEISKEWFDYLINLGIGKLKKEDMQLIYRYKINYQISGIITVIIDWFKNDMPLTVYELADLLNFFSLDTKSQYPDLPNIKLIVIDS